MMLILVIARQPDAALPTFIIAGLDPAIHRLDE
jgi:hypothetical protein